MFVAGKLEWVGYLKLKVVSSVKHLIFYTNDFSIQAVVFFLVPMSSLYIFHAS